MFFSFLLFSFGVFLFIFYNVHYLLLFLGLELILLGVLLMVFFTYVGGLSLPGVFLFLLVMVCMGGFSISLLVSVSRGLGRDFWFTGFLF